MPDPVTLADVIDKYDNRFRDASYEAKVWSMVRADLAAVATESNETIASLRATLAASWESGRLGYARAIDAEARLKAMAEALEEIKKGEGTFSRDQLTFATNVIERSKEIATKALTPDLAALLERERAKEAVVAAALHWRLNEWCEYPWRKDPVDPNYDLNGTPDLIAAVDELRALDVKPPEAKP